MWRQRVIDHQFLQTCGNGPFELQELGWRWLVNLRWKERLGTAGRIIRGCWITPKEYSRLAQSASTENIYKELTNNTKDPVYTCKQAANPQNAHVHVQNPRVQPHSTGIRQQIPQNAQQKRLFLSPTTGNWDKMRCDSYFFTDEHRLCSRPSG